MCSGAPWETLRTVRHLRSPWPFSPGPLLQGARPLLSLFSTGSPYGFPGNGSPRLTHISKSALGAWGWQKLNRISYNSTGSVYFGRLTA